MVTREVKRLTKLIQKFQLKFPQSRLHLLCRSFPQEMDFKVILFWVFNKAGLSAQSRRGGQNRDVVIAIDPNRTKAGLMIGYGLEPVLSQEALDDIILSGQTDLENGEFASAFERIIGSLTEEMRKVCLGLPEAVGLQVKSEVRKTPDY